MLPATRAQLLPLREFGQIFALVTVVSLVFSVAFLVALMLLGPRATRPARGKRGGHSGEGGGAPPEDEGHGYSSNYPAERDAPASARGEGGWGDKDDRASGGRAAGTHAGFASRHRPLAEQDGDGVEMDEML